jgi:hypothetical protein
LEVGPTPEAAPDLELIGQWIAIAAMLASAEELRARGGGGWPALAIVAADTANEAILGTVAGNAPKPPAPSALWPDIYNAAVRAFRDHYKHPMTESLMRRVRQIHRHRNGAVHDGIDPGPRVLDSALATAAELRSLAVDALELLEAFRTSGPSRAVAGVVKIAPIGDPLAEAEDLLNQDALEAAADKCAIALEAALERAKPNIRSYKGLTARRDDDRVDSMFAIFAEQRQLHEAWILALGLGLRPIELRRLQRVLGQPMRSIREVGEVSEVMRDKSVKLTRPTVQWAVRTTTDVVFRLWQSESLAPRPWPFLDDEDEE